MKRKKKLAKKKAPIKKPLVKRNRKNTPTKVIIGQLNDPRPLPMGRAEFEEWADRIISGAVIERDPEIDEERFIDSLKFTLANLVLHLGPTESHKPDAFFIHSLRKLAANQVADAIRVELRDKAKSRLAAEEASKASEVGDNQTA